MSDIRFNRWLHQSGTGGVYQDSAGNVGIGTSVPTTALDVQGGNLKIGSNTLSSSGVSTFSNISVTGGSITGLSTIGVTTVTATSLSVNGNNYPSSGPLGNRNRIINGDMRLDQRNSGASVSATAGVYPVDRFEIENISGGGTATTQRSTTVPTGQGFTNSLLVTVTGTDTSLASTDYYTIRQIIEGQNVADLQFGTNSASTVTISFWVRSSVTGTYCFSLTNGGNSRGYPVEYSISSANTWEKKIITIPGDTTGTWGTDNGRGIQCRFCMGTGTSRQGTANTWNAGEIHGTSNQTNLFATNGATFYLTGVQLERGTVATPFEIRSYGQELALAQRYYQKSYNATDVPGTATSNGTEWLTLPTSGRIAMTTRLRVPMRANCTVKLYDWAGNIDRVRTSGGNNQTTFTIQVANETAFTVDTTSTSVTELLYQYTATAEL